MFIGESEYILTNMNIIFIFVGMYSIFMFIGESVCVEFVLYRQLNDLTVTVT